MQEIISTSVRASAAGACGGLVDDERRLQERVRTIAADMGVAELARRLELNHESVRRYVRGRTSPPALFLLRLAERCEVDCRWLLTGQPSDGCTALRSASTQALVRELDRRIGAPGTAR